jgi:hypothetical protein
VSNGNSPQDDADLKAFLARESPVSTDYDNLELVEPTAALDATILAAAKAAATTVAQAAVTSAAPAVPKPVAAKVLPARPPLPVEDDDDDDDDDTAALPAARRPRWMVPAALAASVLAAVGISFSVLGPSPTVSEGKSGLGLLFAKRARERSEADKAAAAAAAEELEVMVMEGPPPPPSFETDRPAVADLDAAIALIRRELVSAERQEALADSATAEAPVVPAAPAGMIQPRDRRLAKILELYDEGNPDLARDALEIFLRDFADDPVSRGILGKP